MDRYKYKGSRKEKALKLAAKDDVLEILKVASRMYLRNPTPELKKQIEDIKSNYDKI